jgi:molybdopterin-guanine dinucleotide biosynthesis protein A
MVDRRAIVAVMAGGLGRRLGGAKPSAVLAGRPLICHPLAAAAEAGLEVIVVAKPSTVLPPLDVRVAHEPEQPRHPLCGLVAALRLAAARARPPAVVAVACDMPFVTGPLLRWLAGLDGAAMAHVGGRDQPLLGRWPVGGLPLVAQALAEGRPLRAGLAALEPTILEEGELSRFGDPVRLCFNVNDPADLRTAGRWLAAAKA